MSAQPTSPSEMAADPGRVQRLTEHLIKSLQEYLDANPDTDYRDMFMAIHNFHKTGVLSQAVRLHLTPTQRRAFFQMAVDTFSAALHREHARLRSEEQGEEPRGN